jgi:DNA-binding MarR family transcriptional regulator
MPLTTGRRCGYARVMTVPAGADEIAIPALLRAARGAYAQAIRSRLAGAGFGDMPSSGPFVLGGMANRGGTAGDLVRALRVSKQAAGQLIDSLVLRGYLERRPDPDDRRRMLLELTERGRAAAEEVRAGVEAVDEDLARRLGSRGMAAFAAGLLALAEIRDSLASPS